MRESEREREIEIEREREIDYWTRDYAVSSVRD